LSVYVYEFLLKFCENIDMSKKEEMEFNYLKFVILITLAKYLINYEGSYNFDDIQKKIVELITKVVALMPTLLL